MDNQPPQPQQFPHTYNHKNKIIFIVAGVMIVVILSVGIGYTLGMNVQRKQPDVKITDLQNKIDQQQAIINDLQDKSNAQQKVIELTSEDHFRCERILQQASPSGDIRK